MPKVIISPATLAGLEAPYLAKLREAGFELVYPRRRAQMNEAEILEQLTGVEASLAGSEPYTPRVLEANPQFKVIARVGVGFDAVDLAAATKCGVAVTITPGTNQESVAEHTFALILALAKNLMPQHLGTVAGQWPRQANLPLRGRTLGLAGLGRIGKAVAERGAAFGMKLLAHEPYPDKGFVAKWKVTLLSWEDLLAQSDYLSLHIPATPQSRHAINKNTLARMKPTAFLINTARGSLVNEVDLIEALNQKRLAGAGLDVFEQEPIGASPLLKMENVVVTPHAAGVDLQSRDDMATSAVDAIIDLYQGKWPAEKVVNAEVRERFRWK